MRRGRRCFYRSGGKGGETRGGLGFLTGGFASGDLALHDNGHGAEGEGDGEGGEHDESDDFGAEGIAGDICSAAIFAKHEKGVTDVGAFLGVGIDAIDVDDGTDGPEANEGEEGAEGVHHGDGGVVPAGDFAGAAGGGAGTGACGVGGGGVGGGEGDFFGHADFVGAGHAGAFFGGVVGGLGLGRGSIAGGGRGVRAGGGGFIGDGIAFGEHADEAAGGGAAAGIGFCFAIEFEGFSVFGGGFFVVTKAMESGQSVAVRTIGGCAFGHGDLQRVGWVSGVRRRIREKRR